MILLVSYRDYERVFAFALSIFVGVFKEVEVKEKLTPNIALRSGSLKRKGMLLT